MPSSVPQPRPPIAAGQIGLGPLGIGQGSTGRIAVARWLAIAAVLLLLVAPALWNGYPLLQYDTGGYLARWYEGYLVPSRSTVFGLYLHLGEGLHFWPMVIAQSALTLWVIALLLRAFGLADWLRVRLALFAALTVLTTLPWLTSVLLTDIFAGLSVLALYLLVVAPHTLRRAEKAGLFLVIVFAAATHTATLAVLMALTGAGIVALLVLRARLSGRGLAAGAVALALGALLLIATNAALSGRAVWTPGGYGIMFGRMLQDGIVARYLDEHCPGARASQLPNTRSAVFGKTPFKLCPYRHELPKTADEFLWGYSVFNTLGRFDGLGEEMRTIALESLIAYPGAQLVTAARATALQLVLVGTGAGVHNGIFHTYGIIERFIPQEVPAMRAARQNRIAARASSGGDAEKSRAADRATIESNPTPLVDFTLVNDLHKPVAWLSMLALLVLLVRLIRDRHDDLALLAATTVLALLANAFVCGALSGPHDRYGARLVWLATLVVLVAAARAWAGARDRVGRSHRTVMASP
jgi:hypothetical protein